MISEGLRQRHLQDLQKSCSCILMLQGTRCLQPCRHQVPPVVLPSRICYRQSLQENPFFPHMATAMAHSVHEALWPSDTSASSHLRLLVMFLNQQPPEDSLIQQWNTQYFDTVTVHSNTLCPSYCQFLKNEEKAVVNVEHINCYTSWPSSFFGSVLKL